MKFFSTPAFQFFRNGRATLKEYEDTVRRLLKGGFADLSPAEREQRVEQIMQAAALAAMGAAPVPLLELPVLAVMVRAIGNVYGVERPGRKALWELLAALGGGLAARQLLRVLPFGGLTQVSRAYGATHALGRAAQLYFRGGGVPPAAEDLRRTFRATMEAKTREQSARLAAADFAAKAKALQELLADGVISEQEFRQKRAALLESL